jgi:hypothetical protein
VISTLTIFLSGCSDTLKVSDTIDITTTKNSIDVDYNNLIAVVQKIDRGQLKEKISAKYPDIVKHPVWGIVIKSIKKTAIFKKEIKNTVTQREANKLYVEITMYYDKSVSNQAIQVIKDYKAFVNDELLKSNIKIED